MPDQIAILQFGTSRFLQAHVDLFVGEARAARQDVGRIAVIQSTGAARSRVRMAAFRSGQPYCVHIRGLEQGTAVDRFVRSDSIATGLDAATEWESARRISREVTHIVSNTGDLSYRPDPEDRQSRAVPISFPAKLIDLLLLRYRDGQRPPVVLPCELRAVGNGRELRASVVGLARALGHEPGFVAWLDEECVFANTLVDRIVSGDLQPVGAVAEPFALWAIEAAPGVDVPFSHGAVAVSADYADQVRLKLYLLNVAHLVMLQASRESARPYTLSREAMADAGILAELVAAYEDELLPTFAAAGMEGRARRYVATTLERFRNPFLAHRFADMEVDLEAKIRERVGRFLAWSDTLGVPPRQARLRRLMALAEVAGSGR